MAPKDNDDVKPEGEEQDVSLDLSQAAVKRMIADAKERGYITYDQLNSVMPPEQVSSEQIEDVMSMLSEMGINIIENEESEEAEVEAANWSKPRLLRAMSPWLPRRPRRLIAPMTPCGCTCAKWVRLNFCRAKAKLPSPSGLKLAATR